MIKNQEITDANTGVHLAIGTTGTGKDAVSGADINPRHWVRITSPAVTTPGANGENVVVKPQAISTIYFDAQGDIARIAPHDLTPSAPAPSTSAEAAPVKQATPAAAVKQALVDRNAGRLNDLDAAGAVGAINDRDKPTTVAPVNALPPPPPPPMPNFPRAPAPSYFAPVAVVDPKE